MNALRQADARATDLFWTAFDSSALYNTVFKIAYISSSAYIIYLMVNDYKRTHDPNIDTFKVEYLLGGAAALALVFPNRFIYSPSEVCPLARAYETGQRLTNGRSCGRFRSGSRPSRFCRSCSCCSVQERPRQSRPIICSPLASTEHCTSSTGSGDTSQTRPLTTSSRSLSLPVWFRLCSTPTSSTSTTRSGFCTCTAVCGD